MEPYLEMINHLTLDKGIPPLSYDKMPMWWVDPLMEKYMEELKERKKNADKQRAQDKKGGYSKPTMPKAPKIKSPKYPR